MKVPARSNTCTIFRLTTQFDTPSIEAAIGRTGSIRAIRPVSDTSAIYVCGLSCSYFVIHVTPRASPIFTLRRLPYVFPPR